MAMMLRRWWRVCSKNMTEFRTQETNNKYKEAIRNGLNDTCFFCEESRQKIVNDFLHWRIVENNYPYNAVAEVSHLIFPKRHIKINELNEEEISELKDIKLGYITEAKYDYILEAVAMTSIPNHAHLHLLKLIK